MWLTETLKKNFHLSRTNGGKCPELALLWARQNEQFESNKLNIFRSPLGYINLSFQKHVLPFRCDVENASFYTFSTKKSDFFPKITKQFVSIFSVQNLNIWIFYNIWYGYLTFGASWTEISQNIEFPTRPQRVPEGTRYSVFKITTRTLLEKFYYSAE